jgi:hypothetical protein
VKLKGKEIPLDDDGVRPATKTLSSPRKLDIYIVVRYIKEEPAPRAGPARNGPDKFDRESEDPEKAQAPVKQDVSFMQSCSRRSLP